MDMPRSRSQARRDAHTAATRAEIIEAAAVLMRERGYVGTSIAAIADRGGVAVQTIYNTIGSKAEILAAVLAAADHRTGPGRAVHELVSRLTEAASGSAAFGLLALWLADGNQRAAPIRRVLTEAAGIDPEIRELERSSAARSLHACSEAVEALRSRFGLRAGLSDHEAAASIWALAHPQAFQTLVVDLGWSGETYTEWLRSGLAGVLSPERLPAR